MTFQISTSSFQQPVDHNDPTGEVFLQEYHILKPDRAGVGVPVFFVLGNEADATKDLLERIYNAYGKPDNIIFILVEHRGYGQSVTVNPDQSHPSYLTINQSLADYHRFVTHFKKQYTGSWMACGYSYGGALTINFAYRYPEDVAVILASSAVVDWPVFFPEYERQIRINLGEGFYHRLANHTNSFQPKGLSDSSWIEREFLINIIIGISQMQDYRFLKPIFRWLSFLSTKKFVGILRILDNIATKGKGWKSASSFGKTHLSRDEAITGNHNWYTWKYQQSRQTGTFFSTETPGGVLAKSETDIKNECKEMFGEDPPVLTESRWDPRTMLRELKIPAILTIGGRDPWTAICHEKTEWIKDDDFFYDKEGNHCPDRHNAELGKRVLARMVSYLND